jgi:O-antigen/teichoic acid export membrane protein
MLAEKVEPPRPLKARIERHFFDRAGWLMVANIAGGLLMFAVHLLARKTGKNDYGLFITLLTAVMLVPAIPLQMVFAQQTAKALATGRERELAGMIRLICLGLLGVWLLGCLGVFLFQSPILKFWGVSPRVYGSPCRVCYSPCGALCLWECCRGNRIFLAGLEHAEQRVGRLVAAAFAVLVLHGGAVGMMAGVLIGIVAGLGIAVWQTRPPLVLVPQAFDWLGVLRQVIPLLFGFLFVQFLFTGDTLFVKHYFTSGATGGYGSAGTLSRALIWLVGPLATVMFPRIVHSSAMSEETNIMGVVLIGTTILAIGGAAGLAILGRWFVALVYGPDFVSVAGPILPWYAGAMVPLALANVLVNNLMARSRFVVVPFIFLLGVSLRRDDGLCESSLP